MHKLNALRTMMQSIIYTFSSGYLWMLMSGVFFAQVLLQIGYRTVSERYPGAEYLYVLFTHICSTWWYLVVALLVLRYVRGQKCLLVCCMRSGAVQTWGAWWLVAWMTLLSWAKIPLVCEPCVVTEGVDLVLLIVVSFLGVLQLALNFFMIPEIADKNYAILHLYVHAFDELRKQWFRMVQFFLMLFFLFCASALLILFFVYALRTLTECVVLCPWMPRIAETVVEAGATTLTATILVVAQTLFYLHGTHRQAAS